MLNISKELKFGNFTLLHKDSLDRIFVYIIEPRRVKEQLAFRCYTIFKATQQGHLPCKL